MVEAVQTVHTNQLHFGRCAQMFSIGHEGALAKSDLRMGVRSVFLHGSDVVGKGYLMSNSQGDTAHLSWTGVVGGAADLKQLPDVCSCVSSWTLDSPQQIEMRSWVQ